MDLLKNPSRELKTTLSTLCLFVFALSFCIFKVQSTDVFMYLALARDYLLADPSPTHDIYLYSRAAAPLDWIHEWLSYAAFYVAWQIGGVGLLIVLKTFILAAGFLLILRAPPRAANRSALWMGLWALAIFAASFRFIERSSLISDLLTVLLVGWLCQERQIYRGLLAKLSLMFFIWIAFHPGFPIALAFLFLWSAWNLKLNANFRARNLLWLSLPLAALLINPLGWRGVIYPFQFALEQAPVFRHFNYEWFPSYHLAFRFTPEVLAFWLLAIFTTLNIYRQRAFKDLKAWFAIFTIAVAISAVRFIPMACFVLLICNKAWSVPFENRRHLQSALAALLTVIAIHNFFWGYPSSSGPRKPGLALDPLHFPSSTLEFARLRPIAGRLYNTHALGAYLIWLGRTPVFHHGFVTDLQFYQDEVLGVLQSPERFQELSTRYNWRMLLIDKASYPSFYKILSGRPEWKIVSEDEAAYLIYRLEP